MCGAAPVPEVMHGVDATLECQYDQGQEGERRHNPSAPRRHGKAREGHDEPGQEAGEAGRHGQRPPLCADLGRARIRLQLTNRVRQWRCAPGLCAGSAGGKLSRARPADGCRMGRRQRGRSEGSHAHQCRDEDGPRAAGHGWATSQKSRNLWPVMSPGFLSVLQ